MVGFFTRNRIFRGQHLVHILFLGKEEFPARAAAERLVALGRERAGGSGDNISLAIVKLIEAPATPARPAASR